MDTAIAYSRISTIYHHITILLWAKKCVYTIRPTLSDFILGQEIPEDKLLYHS